MVNTIDEAFVEQFKSNVYHLSQQRGSRLGQTVRIESLVGETHNFERLNSVDVNTPTSGSGLHTPSPINDAEHSRRKVSPVNASWGDVVDREDKLRLIISPESEYAIAAANALGRQKDTQIVVAARADATDGDGDPVVFDTNNIVPTILADGLTFDKVLAGVEILNAGEVMDEDRYVVYASRQLTDVLGETEFTSADFNTVRTLMAGQVATFLGLGWVRSELLESTLTVRHCLMYQRMGIGLAINEDMFARIAERADLSFAWQVFARMTMGATRIEEAAVVQVDCTE